MQHRLMSDCHILPDAKPNTGIRMQHRAFLHVGVLAYRDNVVVAANRGTEPNADILTQHYASDDAGARRNEHTLMHRWHALAKLIHGHEPTPDVRDMELESPRNSTRFQ